MQLRSSTRRLLLPLWWVAGVAMAAHFGHTIFGLGGPQTDGMFADYFYNGIIVFAAAACLVRCAIVRVERRAWGFFGAALLCWAAGELYHSLFLADVEVTPFPSVSDAFFVAFYPACLAGLISLVRSRVRALGAALLLDGLVAALAASAVGAALMFDSVLRTLAETNNPLDIAFNLAYPIGDLVVLGAVAGALSLTGWRPGRTLAALAGGLLLVATADSVYLVQSVGGTYLEGSWLDSLWPAGLLAIGWASWQPAIPIALHFGGWRTLALPMVLSLAAVGVLLADQVGHVNGVALALATAAVVGVIVRMAWSLRDNSRLLESTRTEALTDALTALGNRRHLMSDLERALEAAGPQSPYVLVLFDLDGFKDYNDSFGHPAGDALLARRGRALRAAVKGAGSAYRPGGDEFCVLVAASAAGAAETVIAACVAALSERGPGVEVRSSWGAVLLPAEASIAADALRIADRRMYARKGGRRTSARKQSINVLLGVLRERQADLHEHSSSVAELAMRVGERLGMTVDEIDETAHAAELHDIGKVAIPEHVLNKPAPLDRGEWVQMHQHTLVGERILRSAPALEPVARLVRASHERWDGQGYPDGVMGHDIPLGARIISTCDAFDAMISDRPYRTAMPIEAAVEELRGCAGSQFDPDVVEAFCAVLDGDGRPDEDELTAGVKAGVATA